MYTPVAARVLAAGMMVYSFSTAANGMTVRPAEPWTVFLAHHVRRGVVDYAGIRSDTTFPRILDSFSKTDPKSLRTANARLAFWINAYNAFTVKLIVEHYPVKSIKDVAPKPWDVVFIPINGREYSLNQIEHDIIRKEFAEPRVHFALVCAAKGCPRLGSYHALTLESDLDLAAREFLSDPARNRFDPATNTLVLSPIFDWYKSDFVKKSGSVTAFVAPYYTGATISDKTTITYSDYDWSLNGH